MATDQLSPIAAQQLEEVYEKLGEKRLFTRENLEFMKLQLHEMHSEAKLQKAPLLADGTRHTFKDAFDVNYELKHSYDPMRLEIKHREDSNLSIIEPYITMTFKDAHGKNFKFNIPLYHMYALRGQETAKLVEKPYIKFFPYQAIPYPLIRPELATLVSITGDQDLLNRRLVTSCDPQEESRVCPSGTWQSLAMNYIPMFYHPGDRSPNSQGVNEQTAISAKINSILERQAIIKALGTPKVVITKIICFGLRSLYLANDGAEFILHQHYTALDIAKKLSVQVVFQDPSYDDNDKSFLRRVAQRDGIAISFAESPDGLLAIDEGTFVFATGRPGFPLRQLTADLTRDSGGPAAIFWEDLSKELAEDWSTERELHYFMNNETGLYNPVNKHVISMMKNFRKAFNVLEWYQELYDKEGEGNDELPQLLYNTHSTLYLKKESTTTES